MDLKIIKLILLSSFFISTPIFALDVTWTGRDLEVDGYKEIPKGLWGVMSSEDIENPKANGVEMIYHHWDDLRKAPPLAKDEELSYLIGVFRGSDPALQRLRSGSWKKWLEHVLNRIPLENTPPMDFLVNPMDWESGHGINGYGKFFDKDKAKSGRKVTLNGKDVESLVWDEPKWILKEFRGGLRMDWTSKMVFMGNRFTIDEWYEPQPLKKGLKVKISNKWAVLDQEWWAKDDLSIPKRGVTWWSYNPEIWRSPLHVENRRLFLELVKTWTANPGSVTSGKEVSFGWGRPWLGSDSVMWKDVIQPMIEIGGGNIFHLSDRLKGEPTDSVLAGYELAWNHSINLRHRSLSFRTMGVEGTLHPTQPDGTFVDPPLKGSPEYEKGSFLYHVKDLISRMMLMPHKARYRFLSSEDQGIGALAALEFMDSMKGQMVALEVKDPNILGVASRNGNQHRVTLMNDDFSPRNVRLGFSGYRFKGGQIKVVRPEMGGTFASSEQKLTMTSILNLKLGPREVLQLVFECEKSGITERRMKQFPMKGPPSRRLSSSKTYVTQLDEVEEGERLVLRLSVDRAVSGIELKAEGWNQTIHHLRGGLQDHPLTLSPKEGRWGIQIKSPTDRALFEGASLFLVKDKD